MNDVTFEVTDDSDRNTADAASLREGEIVIEDGEDGVNIFLAHADANPQAAPTTPPLTLPDTAE